MTEHNHRRSSGTTLPPEVYSINGKPWGHPDKSMQGWGRRSTLSDKSIGASIGNDFTNGHRGMARAVAGAKKFVRSRFRLHENAATREMARAGEPE